MFCEKCGTEQRIGEKYCRKCGTLYPVYDNNIQDKTVNNDLSEKENNIQNKGEESSPEVVSVSKSETDNDIKNVSNNEIKTQVVEQLNPTVVLTEEQICYERKVEKTKLFSKSVAILSFIILICKAGFSASIGWWILLGAIFVIAFVKIDRFDKKDVIAKRCLYICALLSVVLLIFAPNSGSVGGGGSRSIKDIAGTYTFGYGTTFELVVNDDGRVWTIYDDYSGEVCGEVDEIVEEGFSLSVDPIGSIHYETGATGLRIGGNLVFNTEERKLYFSIDDYNNRDVEKVDKASFSYSPTIKRIKQ